MKKRSFLAAAAAATLAPRLAFVQADYPNKPVKLIVAFPPGGTSARNGSYRGVMSTPSVSRTNSAAWAS